MNDTTPGPAPVKNGDALLEVRGLCKYFSIRRGLLAALAGRVKAVDDVSFSLRRGETLGLVGESGCGKTTTGRAVLRLIEPTAGTVRFEGTELTDISQSALQPFRRKMQIIFQDPFSSLNPRMTVEQIVGEGLTVHGLASSAGDRRGKVLGMLDRVGLPAQAVDRYPHEFSGGQRQRIGIARALAVDPSFIVCDEPVSALDVSVQAQIVNLLMDLQAERNLSYLFIAHDLSVVEHISTRVAVMYLGHIVETGSTKDLYGDPRHPYTRALLSSVPIREPGAQRTRQVLPGEPPSPIHPPPGCPLAPRCPIARPECSQKLPELEEMGAPDHLVRCPYVKDLPVYEKAGSVS
ncbi:MAG: ATP-binding cassette domain-containing protein [Planctomycetes bacterium]|nr:ATP-binding cassette domain-containing protein [Planctomycetota bacterium]